MNTHVLNGDALRSNFPFGGRIVVCRECLIDGPVSADSPAAFWALRRGFLHAVYGADPDEYMVKVQRELEILSRSDDAGEINLWFEHDLFCQVNMWFILHYLTEAGVRTPVMRVMPPSDNEHDWAGFANMDEAELRSCYEKRIGLTRTDFDLGCALWKAYASKDMEKLLTLAQEQSPAFPLLNAVCKAHVDRFPASGIGRPQQRLKEILSDGATNFDEIFKRFSRTEGVYGFGDTQVMNLLSEME